MHGHVPVSMLTQDNEDYGRLAYEQPTREGCLVVIGFEEAAKVAKILTASGYDVSLKTLEFVVTRFGRTPPAATETYSTINASEEATLQKALDEVETQIRDGYDMHMSYYGDKCGIHFRAENYKEKL